MVHLPMCGEADRSLRNTFFMTELTIRVVEKVFYSLRRYAFRLGMAKRKGPEDCSGEIPSAWRESGVQADESGIEQ